MLHPKLIGVVPIEKHRLILYYETDEIKVATSLFSDIGEDASEGLMAEQGSGHNGNGVAIAKSTVENVGKKVASKLASVSKDSIKKVYT